MPDDIKKTLSRLGLRENEVQVYLTCLQNKGGMFVAELTKLSGLKRSTVNLVLERLSKHGYVTYHLDGSRKRFFAESPETLLHTFEDSIGELKSVLPLLLMTSGGESKTKVRFFQGKEGLQNMFADILLAMRINRDPQKEIMIIASGKDIFKVLPEHQKQFIDKRVKAKIPVRWIAPKSDVVKHLDWRSKEELREMRFFDGTEFPFTIEVDVYGGNMALMNLGKDPSGVIIENEPLAHSFRSLFNLLWDHLK